MKSKIVCSVYRCAAAVLFMVMPFMIKAYTISGRMVEKETGEACLGVSYNVYLLPDTVKPILSGMTGEGGRFNFSVRKSGEYCLTTSAAGYSPLRHIFEVKSNTDLGVLTLSAAAKELDEVVAETLSAATAPSSPTIWRKTPTAAPKRCWRCCEGCLW